MRFLFRRMRVGPFILWDLRDTVTATSLTVAVSAAGEAYDIDVVLNGGGCRCDECRRVPECSGLQCISLIVLLHRGIDVSILSMASHYTVSNLSRR
jgi:hypothetical protein